MQTATPLTLRHLQGFQVTQCIVVEWHVQDGGAVRANDVVATVETRKVTAELKAGADGVLRHKFAAGEYADITDSVGWVEPFAPAAESDSLRRDQLNSDEILVQ